MGQPWAAAPLLARALHEDPDDVATLHNLAAALQQLDQLQAAEVIYGRLLGSGKAGPQSWMDYGLLLLRQDRPVEAERALGRALACLPREPFLRGLLAQAALSSGHWRDAVPHLEQVIDQEPDPTERRWNRAALDLLAGRWQEGWAGFEARWQTSQRRTTLRTFPQPAWDGSPIPDATLLLWAEQGLGDSLFALRYLPRLHALGPRLRLQLQPALLPLVAPLGGIEVLPDDGAVLASDFQIPLLSLPRLLRDEPDAASFVPYIRPPARSIWGETLVQRLAALPPGPRIGLVWHGGDGFLSNQLRSLDDTHASDLLLTPDVQWVALQAGQACPWAVALDLGPELTDFTRTAEALATLDRVITVDTATANLAGAMGIEAWVLLHLSCDWRWMLGGERSPWYPTLRLFRQRRTGRWDEVIATVQSALQEGRGTC